MYSDFYKLRNDQWTVVDSSRVHNTHSWYIVPSDKFCLLLSSENINDK